MPASFAWASICRSTPRVVVPQSRRPPPAPAYEAGSGDGSRVPVQILTSGPDLRWRAIRQLYFAMIVSAQRRVRLQFPFFILDATIAEAPSNRCELRFTLRP